MLVHIVHLCLTFRQIQFSIICFESSFVCLTLVLIERKVSARYLQLASKKTYHRNSTSIRCRMFVFTLFGCRLLSFYHPLSHSLALSTLLQIAIATKFRYYFYHKHTRNRKHLGDSHRNLKTLCYCCHCWPAVDTTLTIYPIETSTRSISLFACMQLNFSLFFSSIWKSDQSKRFFFRFDANEIQTNYYSFITNGCNIRTP